MRTTPVTVSRVQNLKGGTTVDLENLACFLETTGVVLQTTQGVAYDGFLANRVLRNHSFAPKHDFYTFWVVFL